MGGVLERSLAPARDGMKAPGPITTGRRSAGDRIQAGGSGDCKALRSFFVGRPVDFRKEIAPQRENAEAFGVNRKPVA